MASGHVNRANRPNTWLHRPMLQNVKKLLLTPSRPHMTPSRPDPEQSSWTKKPPTMPGLELLERKRNQYRATMTGPPK